MKSARVRDLRFSQRRCWGFSLLGYYAAVQTGKVLPTF